jgi:hypothetical protein
MPEQTAPAQPDPLSTLTLDGWLNTISGMGTSRDKRSNTTLQAQPELTSQQLDVLYNENWLAKRIVELLPQQAFRKEPTGIDESDRERWHALNQHELYPQGVFLQGLFSGRLFGGALILPGFATGQPTEEAPEPGAAGNEVLWLDVVPWHMLTVEQKETDANSKRFGLPVILRVTGQHPRNNLRFHISRSIICEGVPRAQPTVAGQIRPWQSVLQSVNETLRDYDMAWAGVSNLLDEASVGVMKLQGLFRMLSSKDQSLAQARMSTIAASKSMIRTLFLDADGNESFERTEVSFASLPQLMQQINLRMAGGADLPATKLFGQEPAGMNATGENDIRQFYDSVGEYRARSAIKLQKLMSWCLGKKVALRWPSLWEQTDKEISTTRLQNAQADKIWSVDIGCVNALDVALSRIADGSLGLNVDPEEVRKDIAEQEAKALADQQAQEAAAELAAQQQQQGADDQTQAKPAGAKPKQAPPAGAKPPAEE